jgi:hypothetical protein
MFDDLKRFCALAFPDPIITLNGLEGDRPFAATSFGAFDEDDLLFAAARKADGHTNLYLNCNQVHSDILGRANNQLKPYQKRRYVADDVIRRLRLVFDCDGAAWFLFQRSSILSRDRPPALAVESYIHVVALCGSPPRRDGAGAGMSARSCSYLEDQ